MSVRFKVYSLVGLIFITLLVSLNLILSTVISNRFQQFEEEETLKQLKRIERLLQVEESNIVKLTSEYSSWDNTKEFITTRESHYIDSNFSRSDMRWLDIDMVLIYDNEGMPVSETNRNLLSGNPMPLPSDLDQMLTVGTPLISHPSRFSQTSGFLKTSNGLLLLVSNPILDTNDQGPVSGSLIFAKYYDDRRMRKLSQLLEADLTLLPFHADELPQSVITFYKETDSNSSFFVEQNEDDTIHGYALIRDIFNNPIYLVKVTERRELYLQGRNMQQLLQGGLFLTIFIACTSLFVVLNQLVTRNFENLNQYFQDNWKRDKEFQTEFSLRKNEISELDRSINQILTRLQTNRAKLDDLQTELDRAQKAIQHKNNIIATMSHALQTPLDEIVDLKEVVIDQVDIKTWDDMSLTKFSEGIDTNTNRLLFELNNIFVFSKLESGNFQVKSESFNPYLLLKSIDDASTKLAQKKNLQFRFYTPIGLPTFLLGDKHSLHLILMNLISNVIEFNAEGSVPVQATWLSPYLQLTVQGVGVDISETELDLIFNEFKEFASPLNQQIDIYGLRFLIVKKLVDILGGSIGVKSKEGQGALFMVQLPFNQLDG